MRDKLTVFYHGVGPQARSPCFPASIYATFPPDEKHFARSNLASVIRHSPRRQPAPYPGFRRDTAPPLLEHASAANWIARQLQFGEICSSNRKNPQPAQTTLTGRFLQL
jgi:hypothetical protein